MLRLISFLSFILLIVFSCKKEEPAPIEPEPEPDPEIPCDTTFIENALLDTVFPSDYLMAYPGSWWEYSNGTIDSCIAWEPANLYEASQSGNCVTITNNILVLPRMKNASANKVYAFFESMYFVNESNKTASKIQQITEGVGNECYLGISTGGEGNYAYEATTTYTNTGHFDSLDVAGQMFYDVIRMKKETDVYYWHIGGGPTYRYDYFYAMNMGLIRTIKIWTSYPQDTINLINYHIEPY